MKNPMIEIQINTYHRDLGKHLHRLGSLVLKVFGFSNLENKKD